MENNPDWGDLIEAIIKRLEEELPKIHKEIYKEFERVDNIIKRLTEIVGEELQKIYQQIDDLWVILNAFYEIGTIDKKEFGMAIQDVLRRRDTAKEFKKRWKDWKSGKNNNGNDAK